MPQKHSREAGPFQGRGALDLRLEVALASSLTDGDENVEKIVLEETNDDDVTNPNPNSFRLLESIFGSSDLLGSHGTGGCDELYDVSQLRRGDQLPSHLLVGHRGRGSPLQPLLDGDATVYEPVFGNHRIVGELVCDGTSKRRLNIGPEALVAAIVLVAASLQRSFLSISLCKLIAHVLAVL